MCIVFPCFDSLCLHFGALLSYAFSELKKWIKLVEGGVQLKDEIIVGKKRAERIEKLVLKIERRKVKRLIVSTYLCN